MLEEKAREAKAKKTEEVKKAIDEELKKLANKEKQDKVEAEEEAENKQRIITILSETSHPESPVDLKIIQAMEKEELKAYEEYKKLYRKEIEINLKAIMLISHCGKIENLNVEGLLTLANLENKRIKIVKKIFKTMLQKKEERKNFYKSTLKELSNTVLSDELKEKLGNTLNLKIETIIIPRAKQDLEEEFTSFLKGTQKYLQYFIKLALGKEEANKVIIKVEKKQDNDLLSQVEAEVSAIIEALEEAVKEERKTREGDSEAKAIEEALKAMEEAPKYMEEFIINMEREAKAKKTEEVKKAIDEKLKKLADKEKQYKVEKEKEAKKAIDEELKKLADKEKQHKVEAEEEARNKQIIITILSKNSHPDSPVDLKIIQAMEKEELKAYEEYKKLYRKAIEIELKIITFTRHYIGIKNLYVEVLLTLANLEKKRIEIIKKAFKARLQEKEEQKKFYKSTFKELSNTVLSDEEKEKFVKLLNPRIETIILRAKQDLEEELTLGLKGAQKRLRHAIELALGKEEAEKVIIKVEDNDLSSQVEAEASAIIEALKEAVKEERKTREGDSEVLKVIKEALKAMEEAPKYMEEFVEKAREAEASAIIEALKEAAKEERKTREGDSEAKAIEEALKAMEEAPKYMEEFIINMEREAEAKKTEETKKAIDEELKKLANKEKQHKVEAEEEAENKQRIITILSETSHPESPVDLKIIQAMEKEELKAYEEYKKLYRKEIEIDLKAIMFFSHCGKIENLNVEGLLTLANLQNKRIEIVKKAFKARLQQKEEQKNFYKSTLKELSNIALSDEEKEIFEKLLNPRIETIILRAKQHLEEVFTLNLKNTQKYLQYFIELALGKEEANKVIIKVEKKQDNDLLSQVEAEASAIIEALEEAAKEERKPREEDLEKALKAMEEAPKYMEEFITNMEEGKITQEEAKKADLEKLEESIPHEEPDNGLDITQENSRENLSTQDHRSYYEGTATSSDSNLIVPAKVELIGQDVPPETTA